MKSFWHWVIPTYLDEMYTNIHSNLVGWLSRNLGPAFCLRAVYFMGRYIKENTVNMFTE